MTSSQIIKPLLLLLAALVAPLGHAAEAAVPDPFTGWLKSFKTCRARYAEIDARVQAAGAGDANYYRVPGYPYFRTDRVLASFAREVTGIEEIGGWTRRMREFDQEAREFEYLNLGMSTQERAAWRFELLQCGKALASIELDDPAAYQKLLDIVAPKAEYTVKSAAPQGSSCLASHESSLLQGFKDQLSADTKLQLWQVTPVEDLGLADKGYAVAFMDELGFPGLTDSQWRAMAEKYAPALWIETRSTHDQPGSPQWFAGTLGVSIEQPSLNYQITFTRFGEARLVQINYFYWFGGDASDHKTDVDGGIWRVTLDNQAMPLVYESLHASGRDHLWFPAQPMKLKAGAKPVLPQAEVPEGPLALRLQAGSHALRRVVALSEAKTEARRGYTLQRYENLFTLPTSAGASRNLFGPDGLVPGTQDSLACLWSGRVAKPGALRVLGRLPTSYTGISHFDDARLLDEIFVPPAGLMLPPTDTPPL